MGLVVVLLHATWAVPSSPARLTAAELGRSKAPDCVVVALDVSITLERAEVDRALRESLPAFDDETGFSTVVETVWGVLEQKPPVALPTWLLIPSSGEPTVITGAVPKYVLAGAIDEALRQP